MDPLPKRGSGWRWVTYEAASHANNTTELSATKSDDFISVKNSGVVQTMEQEKSLKCEMSRSIS
jgi:hypothetical protein